VKFTVGRFDRYFVGFTVGIAVGIAVGVFDDMEGIDIDSVG